MHRCLAITKHDSQKLSIRRQRKEMNSLRTSLEEWETASVARRNSNHRSTFLTFLALEPDGLKIMALPLRCPDSTPYLGAGARLNMDSLHLLFRKQMKAIQPKLQKGSPLAGSYCGKSFTDRIFCCFNLRHQSRNKESAYEATTSDELSREYSQNSLTCSASSSMTETGSIADNLSDTVSGSEKVDNVKRKSRKRRKKGKNGKKLSGASSSTGPHVLSVECADGSSASIICGNSGWSEHCGRVSLSTAPAVSLPENGNMDESPKPCIADHDEPQMDIPSASNLGHQTVLQDSEFPVEDGIGSTPRVQVSHCNDRYTRGHSDMDDNSDGYDEKHAEKEVRCSAMKNPISLNQDTAMQKISDTLGASSLNQVLYPQMYLPHLLSKAGVPEQKETSHAESSRENPSTGSLNHKLVPIELKDPVTSSISSSAHVHSNEPAERWTPTDAAEGISQKISSEAAVVCVSQSSGDVTCDSDKTEELLPTLGNQGASTIEDLKDKVSAAKCMKFEYKDLNAVEDESNRILEAVNNACRAQLASEAVQTITGGPVAEFERFLFHSAPVVCGTINSSLRYLWEWYQRTGSYGLEIRAEEFGSSKGPSAGFSAFHAYFVPYLSAIQLFQSCGSDSVYPTEDLGEKSRNISNPGRLPILSSRFPQPCREDSISINELCNLKQSSSPPNDHVQLTDTTGSSDLQLLFEYFESQQPQERQPLYDKITELIRGDGHSRSKVYGDPTKLDSVNLRDLHPRSWYSVAWYPIYRIPNGNFRAAFLTYHSLGCLVHRNANFESQSVDACIACPVVGLQSYNAQDECWFKPRHSGPRQTTVTPGRGLNFYSGVVEGRLRTLKETASLMARAVVKKEGMTSVNRHPDYEFFLSRRR